MTENVAISTLAYGTAIVLDGQEWTVRHPRGEEIEITGITRRGVKSVAPTTMVRVCDPALIEIPKGA